MNYGRLGYDTLLDGEGTRVGAAYSAPHYRPGDPLSALDAHGAADSIPVRRHVDRRGLSRHMPPSRVSDNTKRMHFCYFGVIRLTAPASAYVLDKT